MTALFTTAELSSLLQQPTLDATLATLAHDLAVGVIAEYAPRALGPSQSRTVNLPVIHGSVRLPHRPVVSVTSVNWVNGDGSLTAIPDYLFNGIDEISGLGPYRRNDLWFRPRDIVGEPGTAQVIYVGGVVSPSAGVKSIGMAIAARIIGNTPNGLDSETIGSYSYRTSGDPGITLTPEEQKALRRYRINAITSRTR